MHNGTVEIISSIGFYAQQDKFDLEQHQKAEKILSGLESKPELTAYKYFHLLFDAVFKLFEKILTEKKKNDDQIKFNRFYDTIIKPQLPFFFKF